MVIPTPQTKKNWLSEPYKSKKIGYPDPTKRNKLSIWIPPNEKIWLPGPHETKKIGYPDPQNEKNFKKI